MIGLVFDMCVFVVRARMHKHTTCNPKRPITTHISTRVLAIRVSSMSGKEVVGVMVRARHTNTHRRGTK